MLALLADIHANLEALEAVLADARAHGTTHWVVLGDTIGFGGAPLACAQRVQELHATALRGNHEEALLHPELFAAFPAVQRMSVRTRDLLPPQLLSWLTSLPYTAEAQGLSLTHATFHASERWGRLSQEHEAALSFSAQQAPLAAFGHTHRPTLFSQNAAGLVEKLPLVYDASGSFTLSAETGRRYLINPGSVGQPRDGDPRAAYALWDSPRKLLTLRRVPYEVEKAALAMLTMGLPPGFAEALKHGHSPL